MPLERRAGRRAAEVGVGVAEIGQELLDLGGVVLSWSVSGWRGSGGQMKKVLP